MLNNLYLGTPAANGFVGSLVWDAESKLSYFFRLYIEGNFPLHSLQLLKKIYPIMFYQQKSCLSISFQVIYSVCFGLR